MSTARITIGGLDVRMGPGEGVAGGFPVTGNRTAADVDPARQQVGAGHPPVVLTVACVHWPLLL
jgi:hypothetical protein